MILKNKIDLFWITKDDSKMSYSFASYDSDMGFSDNFIDYDSYSSSGNLGDSKTMQKMRTNNIVIMLCCVFVRFQMITNIEKMIFKESF